MLFDNGKKSDCQVKKMIKFLIRVVSIINTCSAIVIFVNQTVDTHLNNPRPLTLTLNGTVLQLDSKTCTGGILLKEKSIVTQFCGLGVFVVRKDACSGNMETFIGVPKDFSCTSDFREEVQIFMSVDVQEDDDDDQGMTEVTTAVVDSSSNEVKGPTSTLPTSPVLELQHTEMLWKNERNETGSMNNETTTNVSGKNFLAVTVAEESHLVIEDPSEWQTGKPGTLLKENSSSQSNSERGPNSSFRTVGMKVQDKDFAGPKALNQENLEFSSEVELRGGPWMSPGKNSRPQFEDMEDPFERWLGKSPQSPIYEAHLTLLKRQIDFELLQSGVHSDETGVSGCTPAHVSVIGKKDLPLNTKWFKILTEIATTASALIPQELLRDPFSTPRTQSSCADETESALQPQPFHSFFDDVLRIFGYFARSYDDVIFMHNGTIQILENGFTECREKAEIFRNSCIIGEAGGKEDCSPTLEVKAIRISQPVWNDMEASYTKVKRTLDFTSSVNSYPPVEERINPSKWLFAEIMWYSVQMSYVFCYETFAEVDPNSFMVAFDAMLKLFEDDLITRFWNQVGGNIEQFELLLPYIRHSGSTSKTAGSDFRHLLDQFDRLYGGVRAGALISGFGRLKRARGKQMTSWGALIKRRKRSAETVLASETLHENLTHEEGSQQVLVNEPDMTGSGVATTEANVSVQGNSILWENLAEVKSELGLATEEATSTTDLTTNTPTDTPRPYTKRNLFTQTRWDDNERTKTDLNRKPRNLNENSPETTSTSATTTNSFSDSISMTTVPSTLPPSLDMPFQKGSYRGLKEYEIWDGLAYCLTKDNEGAVRPSILQIKKAGLC